MAQSPSGKLPGLVHSSAGQEAVAVVVCSNLRPDDTIVGTSCSIPTGRFLKTAVLLGGYNITTALDWIDFGLKEGRPAIYRRPLA